MCALPSHFVLNVWLVNLPARAAQEEGRARALSLRGRFFARRSSSLILCTNDTSSSQTVSYEDIFPGNFGVGGAKNFLGKKTFLTRKFSGKISSPRISSGNFGSNSPSRGNFEAQNFLETRGNFTRKFWDHLII